MKKNPRIILIAGLLILFSFNKIKADTIQSYWVPQEQGIPVNPYTKERAFVRHAKGMVGLGILGGMTSVGYKVGAEWSYRFLSSHVKLLLSTEWAEHKFISYRSVLLTPLFFHTWFTNYDNFCFNLGGGTVLAYNKKKNKKIRGEFVSSYNIGVTVMGEMEFFIFKTVELIISAGPIIYILKDNYDRVSYQAHVALKYNF